MELVGSHSQSKQHATQGSNENDNDDLKDKRKNGDPRHSNNPHGCLDKPYHRTDSAICRNANASRFARSGYCAGTRFPASSARNVHLFGVFRLSKAPGLDEQDANLKKAIERTYNAKRKPFDDFIAARIVMIKWYREQLKKAQDEWQRLFYAPGGPVINRKRLQDLNGLTTFYTEAIKEEVEKIQKAYKELGKIEAWYRKMLEWAQEKYEKAVDALEQLTRDCLANERDDD